MGVCPVFVDETGVLSESAGKQPVYGIGMLVVPDVREITDSFYRLHFNFVSKLATERRRIRNDIQARCTPPTVSEVDRMMLSTRHHEYKFANATRYNVQQYIDILNLYFSFPGLEFHSLIMDRHDPNANLGKWHNDPWEAYTYFARKLLSHRLKRDAFAVVDLQGKPSKSTIHLEDVLCSIDSVKGCLRATSDMSIYLQLVDLLLGCVQFDFKTHMGYHNATSGRARDKQQLVRLVKSKLNMKQDGPFLPDGRSFNKWETPSAFTIWKGDW